MTAAYSLASHPLIILVTEILKKREKWIQVSDPEREFKLQGQIRPRGERKEGKGRRREKKEKKRREDEKMGRRGRRREEGKEVS